MEERLKDYLGHDEKIIWTGRPETFTPMDSTHKNYYIRRSIIVAVISILLIAIYIPLSISTGAGVKPGVLIVVVAVAVFAFVSPVLDNRKLAKMEYVLTNEKLLIVSSSEVRSVKLSAIPTAHIAADADGHSSLLCGPDCDKLPAHKRRVATLTGAVLDQDSMMCDRFVMYAVNDVKGLRKASVGLLTIA